MEDSKGKVILSLLAGATAGIVAGLLLAPETGEEARTSLKKSASRFSDDLNKLLQEGKSRLNSLKDQAPADSEQHRNDRTAADDLLNSLSQPGAADYARQPAPEPEPAEGDSQRKEETGR